MAGVDESASLRTYVLAWLGQELEAQPAKFERRDDDAHTRGGLGADSWWWQQLTNYFGRAGTLGLDTLGGRQALAKFTATAVAMLESTVRSYGSLPEPGRTSGDIVDWHPE